MTDEHRGLGRHVGQVVQHGGALVGVHLGNILIMIFSIYYQRHHNIDIMIKDI